jgi:hypothetical protein
MAKRYEPTAEQFKTIRDILPRTAGDLGRNAQALASCGCLRL